MKRNELQIQDSSPLIRSVLDRRTGHLWKPYTGMLLQVLLLALFTGLGWGLEYPFDNRWDPRAGQQYAPSVASDGSGFLAVWRDENRTNGTWLYCARLSQEGTVLDPPGIPIVRTSSDALTIIAGNKNGYLMVWRHAPDNPNDGITLSGIRLSNDGVAIDQTPIVICREKGERANVSVASDGVGFFVVWEERRTETPAVYGSRVSGAGVVLDPGGFRICRSTTAQQLPSVASNGEHYLVAWTDERGRGELPSDIQDVYSTLVTKDGSILSPEGTAICTSPGGQIGVSVASNGTGFFAAWEDHRNTLSNPFRRPPDIFGARLDANGLTLDPNGVRLALAPPYYYMSPVVAGNYNGYLVAFTHIGDGATRLLDAVTIGNDGLISSAFEVNEATLRREIPIQLSIASNSDEFLVAWEDDRGWAVPDIYGARIKDNVLVDPTSVPISAGSNAHRHPTATFFGEGYLAVWEAWNPITGIDIHGTLISPAGKPIDTTPFPISVSVSDQRNPAVAFNGILFLVVWQDSRYGDFFGTRVTTSGKVLDTPALRISNMGKPNHPAHLVGSSSGFLIVWDDDAGKIFGARVASDGRVMDTNGIPISSGQSPNYLPRTASDGRDYIVISQQYDTTNGTAHLRGIKVRAEGIIDSAPIPITGPEGDQGDPMVVWDHTNYLVLWQEQSHAGQQGLCAVRVSTRGEVMGPAVVIVGNQSQWHGLSSVIQLESSTLVLSERPDGGSVLYEGVRMDSSGHVLDQPPLVLSQADSYGSWEIAGGSFNDCLLMKLDPNAAESRISGTIVGFDEPSVMQSPSLALGRARISWSSLPGRTYQLESCTDLRNPAWSNVGDPITAVGVSAYKDDLLGFDQKRFYRVIRLP